MVIDLVEYRWLVARERGDDDAGDLLQVPNATRALYQELSALIARLPMRRPGADWRCRVLETIARPGGR